ncbi:MULTISPECIES: TetR/AcrR family transcriptional regulator [Actinoalloteichus]|uniref:Transcriptional regulator, TetR family n=1 Tax=Actinoalloteichus fjordicus TaxID=1612552 RepID=A0AAC9LDY4_9PSEU|nr:MULTISPECIES: TetR/AcrR family transcriptional regulator C-terminal domain-containing protein [Actinoalloteichus]APU16078.1 transcriptional regulator, TetR family [Actinoalloteichus fjordicus]APU22143.1 transcriptional regulator, TetR family [Actinoalloteichus sp. GBA129-24]
MATRRPVLSRERIIHTALAVIDRDGLDALSMRRLGAELGVDAMAVYYHLPDKAALFDGVVEAVYSEVDVDAAALPGPWPEMLAVYLRRLREVLRRHPHAVAVIATRPAYTASVLGPADRAVGRLREEGLTARSAMEITHACRAFTIGFVLAEVGAPLGGPTRAPREAISPADYPHLVEAMAEGYRPDEQYEAGLRAMLDGFARQQAAAGHVP